MYIPNLAPPFEDYDGGIGVALIEDGLKCFVFPWNPMEDDDGIGVYWNNTQSPVWSDVIDGNANERVRVHLSKSLIREGDADPVFYRVTIPGQIPEDSTPKKRYLVKLGRPGGYDDQPSIPGHSGLRYRVPQEIIDSGVGPIEADAGVDITILPYEHMRKNDRIYLAWGRAIVEYLVKEGEVDTEIPIHVDRATIEAGGDGQVTIAYQVVDVCNNYPDEREPWSANTPVVVDLGGNRLDAPQVLVNGIPTQTINLEQLAGADVICRVYVNPTDHAVGDTLRLTWVGTPAQGDSQVIVGPLDQTVEYVPFQYDFSIPNEDVVAIAKGRASVSYVRVRSGEVDRPSKSASVTVMGDIMQPARPGIVEASGSVLDPDLNFYTVSIPYYPGRQSGDHLYIVFEGLDASNSPTSFDDDAYVGSEAEGQPVLRNVDKAEIKRLDGGSLTVYYWINSQRKSLQLQLAVGNGQPSFMEPDVIEADSNNVLDPSKVNPNVGANVIAPYTGTVPGDIIGLRWKGSRSSPPDDERLLNANSAGKPVPFVVPYRYVIDNLNGTVDVDYYLKRDLEPLRYSRVRPLTVGAAMNLSAPSVKEATGTAPSQQLNPVAGKDNLTVVIPDYGVQPGDQVSVTWAGTVGGGSYTTPVQVLPPDREIAMPVSVIAFNLGKPVTVTYTVTRDGESPPSAALNLAVQAIPEASLGMPLIPQAAQGGIGSELDLGNFTGDARVTVAPWPLIAAGQRVWLRVEGTAQNGSDYVIVLAVAEEVTPSQVTVGLSKALLRSELETLRDGSELKVVLEVTFDRSTSQSEAVAFPLRTYVVKALPETLPPPGVEGVPEGGVLDPSQAQIWTRVPGDALLVGDLVVVIWTDKNGVVAEYRSPAKPYTTGDISNNYLRFLIPSADVQRFVGTDVRVTYLRDRNGNITGPSQAFNMSVGVPVPLAFPSFTNEPYRTVPGGQLKDIILLLSREGGAPVPNGKVTLTLPSGFTYADGASGPREFTTGTDGTATVSGVKGHTVPNVYSLIATSGSQSATAPVTITALELIANILVGNSPFGVAVAPDGTRAYVCNYGSRTVSVIDTATNQVLTNIPHSLEATEPPRYIAVRPDGIRAYVCCMGLYGISIINTQTNQLLGGITSLYNGEGVAFSPDSTRAYATNGVRLFVINTANDGVVTSFAMGSGASDVVVNPGGTRLYVSEFYNDKVAVVDTTTNQVLGRISAGARPHDLVISPDGLRVYVAITGENALTVINTQTDQILEKIPVRAKPGGIAISPDGSLVFGCDTDNDRVWVVATATNEILTFVPAGSRPTRIAMHPNGSRVYVTNYAGNSVSVIAVG